MPESTPERRHLSPREIIKVATYEPIRQSGYNHINGQPGVRCGCDACRVKIDAEREIFGTRIVDRRATLSDGSIVSMSQMQRRKQLQVLLQDLLLTECRGEK